MIIPDKGKTYDIDGITYILNQKPYYVAAGVYNCIQAECREVSKPKDDINAFHMLYWEIPEGVIVDSFSIFIRETWDKPSLKKPY